MAADPALLAEVTHLELARECLAAMRESADRIADYGVDELASHALGKLRASRLAALTAEPDAPPFFGRIDCDPDAGTDGSAGVDGHQAEVLHIGRRHVRDEVGDPVVVDWRAPIARGFYRATADDRMGVRLRRRFGFHEGVLTSMEDEHLERGQALGLASDLLRAEIERPRVGPMRDIVATIQPDQDELVRAELDTSLCIQGAPGTGKTAVGLHRAAYLLYTYPDRLRRSGVLVVGPNAAFLHYIAQVLPSLGEGGITQSTVPDLLQFTATAAESADLAVLKGDARLADVLRRAVLAHIAKPAQDVVAIVGTRRYRVGAHHLRRYVDDARRALDNGLRWTTARERLRMQVAEDVRRQREDAGGAPSDAETAKIARSPAVKDWVDAVWPALAAPALLARLYDEPGFLRRCSTATLTDDERAALYRRAPTSLRSVKWTSADAVLLDELHGLLHGVDTFVHAVVDEAQDLSAMQCRAVGRRCPLGSVTVLGDLAQATTPWAPGDWRRTLELLGHHATISPLTTGYRVPGEVLEIANRLLPHIARDVPPATSVRAGVAALRFAPRSDLLPATRECLLAEGSLGVLVPDAQADAVLAELRAAGVDAHPLADGDDPRVAVVPASAAKGLEFDSVIVVEPAAIVAAERHRVDGLRRLYVVLTRAVSRLRVVHDEPLPSELAEDAQ
ncbi:HelD family protein [uncultured Jatrophihabitans sp.]|uniref:HelD family protein n=1 Tax=uncultured Jatrophihabitans sp. TaxID=1610747 RepID=UPI0035CB6C38